VKRYLVVESEVAAQRVPLQRLALPQLPRKLEVQVVVLEEVWKQHQGKAAVRIGCRALLSPHWQFHSLDKRA